MEEKGEPKGQTLLLAMEMKCPQGHILQFYIIHTVEWSYFFTTTTLCGIIVLTASSVEDRQSVDKEISTTCRAFKIRNANCPTNKVHGIVYIATSENSVCGLEMRRFIYAASSSTLYLREQKPSLNVKHIKWYTFLHNCDHPLNCPIKTLPDEQKATTPIWFMILVWQKLRWRL